MNDFKVSGRMQVGTVRQNFKDTFGVGLRIYNGQNFEEENATIASLRNDKTDKRGGSQISFRRNMKVGNIEDKFKEAFGITVQIEDKNGKLADNANTLADAER